MASMIKLIRTLFSASSAVLSVTAKTTVEVLESVEEACVDYRISKKLENMPEAERIGEQKREELRNVNRDLLSLLDKYPTPDQLTNVDRASLEMLRQRRQALKQLIGGEVSRA